MKLSDFQVREFYSYKIRSINTKVNDNVIEMFYITDLISQYNKVNKTNKRFNNYLSLKQTQEIIDEFSISSITQNQGNGNNLQNHLNCKGVIEHIVLSTGIASSSFHGYIVNEELLHSCLMWLDPRFAVKVYIFLKQCRAADSQFLDHPDEFIKSRIVPVEESQDWSFMIIPVFKSNEVILKASYCRTKNITKTQFMNPNTIMLHGLPNGFSFKYFVYTELIQVVKSYGGHSNGCHRSSYSISRHVYDNQYKFLMLDITHAINKTRLMLNWGLDYTSEVCTQVLDKLKSLEIPFCTNINMSKDSLELIQKLFSSELIH